MGGEYRESKNVEKKVRTKKGGIIGATYPEQNNRKKVPFSLAKHIIKSKFETVFEDCTDKKYNLVKSRMKNSANRQINKSESGKISDIEVRSRIIDSIYKLKVLPQYSQQ